MACHGMPAAGAPARFDYVLASRPLQRIEVPVDNCPVCPRRPSFAAALSHLVSCMQLHLLHMDPCTATGPYGASTIGHSLVGNALVHYLTAAGIICRPEVRFLHGDRKTRPDFLIADAHVATLDSRLQTHDRQPARRFTSRQDRSVHPRGSSRTSRA